MTAIDVNGTAAAPYWDPFDEVIDTDPHPTWRRLRDEAPLYRNDRYDFWALSRFADVEAASRDAATFTSAHGTVLEFMRPSDFHAGGTMIFMDPPDHTKLRHARLPGLHPSPHGQARGPHARALRRAARRPGGRGVASTTCRTSAPASRPW